MHYPGIVCRIDKIRSESNNDNTDPKHCPKKNRQPCCNSFHERGTGGQGGHSTFGTGGHSTFSTSSLVALDSFALQRSIDSRVWAIPRRLPFSWGKRPHRLNSTATLDRLQATRQGSRPRHNSRIPREKTPPETTPRGVTASPSPPPPSRPVVRHGQQKPDHTAEGPP